LRQIGVELNGQVLQSKAANMQIQHLINLFHGEMTAWRRDLHAHPELGFEEQRTSDFVAGKLADRRRKSSQYW
jgi:metal-dependent amidase/aminoacylase/carboxypeptidase family protein